MKKRLIVRSSMSFSKEELHRARLQAGVGFNLPMTVLNDNKSNFSREVFGLSDSNKFYPGLDINKDIMPKPEDFIDVPFRLLTATIVAGGTWRATDFSKGTILKDSLSKLDGKPVYKDHNTDLDSWVGLVKLPKWTDRFTDADGNIIPAGIDAILSIDAKTNPKIARGVLSGGIFSNSVTVDFDWIPSHDIENQYEFEDRVGTYAEDGRMITRQVVEIHDYYESSLCWLGADPYAKLIDKAGNLVNVDITSTYAEENDKVKNGYSKQGRYEVSLSFDKNVLPLAHQRQSKNNDNIQPMKKEVLDAIRALLGLAPDAEVTEEMVATLQLKAGTADDNQADPVIATQASNFTKFSKMKLVSAVSDEEKPLVEDATKEIDESVVEGVVSLKKEEFTQLKEANNTLAELKIGDTAVTKESLAALVTEKDQLAKDKKTLETSIENDKSFTTKGKEFIQMQKDEAVRLYKIEAGDKASEAVVEMFKKAEPEALEGLLQLHTKGVTAKFSGRCKECGSQDFEFKSSLGTGEGDNTPAPAVEDNSFSAIHKQFDRPSLQ